MFRRWRAWCCRPSSGRANDAVMQVALSFLSCFQQGYPGRFSEKAGAFPVKARYSLLGKSHDLDSGVAKYDSQSSRITAIVEDERTEQSSRSGAASRPRLYETQGVASRQNPDRASDRLGDRDAGDDAEGYEEEAFLRARRRIPVRRGIIPKSR